MHLSIYCSVRLLTNVYTSDGQSGRMFYETRRVSNRQSTRTLKEPFPRRVRYLDGPVTRQNHHSSGVQALLDRELLEVIKDSF